MMLLFRWTFLMILAQAGLAPLAAAIEPIIQVERIRSLSREDAARALPVKLTGVVTYLGWENFVLHDGKESIFADFRFSKARGFWKGPVPDLSDLVPGTKVELEGVTDPGGFSPMVLVTHFKRTGDQPLPPPIRPSIDMLLSGSLNTQWVQVEGVVRKFDHSGPGPDCLTLLVGGQTCPVLLRNPSQRTTEELVDSKVRVRGVVLDLANLRSQVAGLKIHSNGDQDIDIVVPPPADPFQAPRVALSRLIPFDTNANLEHRKVSAGVVTFVVPGRFFYLLDQGSCVRVDSAAAGIHPGDWIEVSGFIDTTDILASFTGAVVRNLGRGDVPLPERVEIQDIINPRTRSWEEMVTEPGYPDSNGRLILLSGVLRRVLPKDKEGKATLVIESGKHLVQAYLPVSGKATSDIISRWVDGSIVEITGVCELEMVRLDELPWFAIDGFHMWLSKPQDLRVISTPPWWTPKRLGFMLAGVLLVLGLALIWGYAMRRQVAQRSKLLAKEISAREAANLEFDAILRERRRLANDLHDTLEQALTGLALQLEVTERSKSTDPELSARHLYLAQQFLERSRNEVHRTVWDLRAHGLDGRDILDVLHERASAMIAGSAVDIEVDRDGEAFPLPDLIAGNLLLLAQEAVTNALKHGGPDTIRIHLRFHTALIELAVEDDGRGFDQVTAPGQRDGHFGLQGMHERVKRLGGKLVVISKPGQGTSILVQVPVQLDPTLAEG